VPDCGLQVDLVPAHADDYHAPLAEQQPNPDRVSGGAWMRFERQPQRTQLVIG
jgi:hypothetical protein